MINKKPQYQKTEQSFRGWGWEEISRWLGAPEITGIHIFLFKLKYLWSDIHKTFNRYFGKFRITDTEEIYIELTRDELIKLIVNIHDGNIIKEQKEKIEGIRTYISRLIEQDHSYLSPLWEGLIKIENETEFLKFVNVLLPYLWD